MLNFLLRTRLGQILLAVGAGLLLAGTFKAWLSVHDASVAQQARAGYVLLAEKAAAVAKADELQRQLSAGALALEEHRKRLLAAELVDQQKSAEREQEILEYEMRLSQANRRCLLNDDDLRFLQHDRSTPEQRRNGARAIPGKSKPSGLAGGLPAQRAPRSPH